MSGWAKWGRSDVNLLFTDLLTFCNMLFSIKNKVTLIHLLCVSSVILFLRFHFLCCFCTINELFLLYVRADSRESPLSLCPPLQRRHVHKVNSKIAASQRESEEVSLDPMWQQQTSGTGVKVSTLPPPHTSHVHMHMHTHTHVRPYVYTHAHTHGHMHVHSMISTLYCDWQEARQVSGTSYTWPVQPRSWESSADLYQLMQLSSQPSLNFIW